MNKILGTLAVPGLEPRIIFCRWRRLTDWGRGDLAAPFWRLYWNPTPGAWIEAGGTRHDLHPDTRLLIAPHTSFRGRHRGPFDHFFVHFTLGEGYVVDGGGVFASRVGAREARRLAVVANAARRSRDCPVPLGLELYAYLVDALREVPVEAWRVPVQDPRIRAAIGLLQANLADPPDNERLAGYVGLHPNSFVRLFRDCVGVPPHRYALLARLDRASADLLHTRLTVDEIARMWGFADRQHFTRALRKHRYVTPGQMRKGGQ
jgi:AraC-like DNA-binding protein